MTRPAPDPAHPAHPAGPQCAPEYVYRPAWGRQMGGRGWFVRCDCGWRCYGGPFSTMDDAHAAYLVPVRP